MYSPFGEKSHTKLNQISPKQLLPVKEEKNKESIEQTKEYSCDILKGEGAYCLVEKPGRGHECSEPIFERLESTSKTIHSVNYSPVNGSVMLLSDTNGVSVANVICEMRKTSSHSCEEDKVISRYEAMEEDEDKLTLKQKYFSSDLTPMKVLIAAAQAKRHLYHSASLSERVLEARVPSDMGSSSRLAHAVDSSEKVYTSNSSNFHTSLGSRSHLLQNGNQSPDADLDQKTSMQVHDTDCAGRFDLVITQGQKPLSRINHTEATVAWKSFEAAVGTLSRTEESIGRATRLAINCG